MPVAMNSPWLPLKIDWNESGHRLTEYISANNISINEKTGANRETAKVSAACLITLRAVLKNNLHVDGIYYGFGSTESKEFDLPTPSGFASSSRVAFYNPNRQGAFIIANAESISPASANVFSRKTLDRFQDSVSIQILFSQADVDESFTSKNGKIFYSHLNLPEVAGYDIRSVSDDTVVGADKVAKVSVCYGSMPGGSVMQKCIQTSLLPPRSSNASYDDQRQYLCFARSERF